MPGKDVFITGATGYVARGLIPLLQARGHRVRGLARANSIGRLPAGTEAVIGDALAADSFAGVLRAGETVVHLVGTPHPNPRKAAEFVRVDLASIRATAAAAQQAGVAHVVYVSVAQPAPVMHAYVQARAAGERALQDSGAPVTVVRPWYVVGEGHWWPLALRPFYALAERIPATRATALRLGLVTLAEMVAALVAAVEAGPSGATRVIEVPEIRRLAVELRVRVASSN